MKKIIIIFPYYGKLHNYFDLHLKSIELNRDVDFLMITDILFTKETPANLKILHSSFSSLIKKIQDSMGYTIADATPYTVCKFRPAFGEIFSEECKGYDFWGYCDNDILFGNIREFISDNILDNYDKILSHGHFGLYRNNYEINSLYKKKYPDCLHSDFVFKSKELLGHFEEYPYGIPRIAKRAGVKIYEKCIFADLDPFYFTFRKVASYFDDVEDDNDDIIQYFKWSNGELFDVFLDINGNELSKPILYVHFHKRAMDNQLSYESAKDIYIYPNFFSDHKCDDWYHPELNDAYALKISNKVKSPKTSRPLYKKLFDPYCWKRKCFLFRVNHIYKIKPYQFKKGGF